MEGGRLDMIGQGNGSRAGSEKNYNGLTADNWWKGTIHSCFLGRSSEREGSGDLEISRQFDMISAKLKVEASLIYAFLYMC